MNIFLIGFMGSGKSTIGKKLASRMKRDFVDLDQVLSELENLSVQSIFELKGEAYFRTLEREWLEKANIENAIISLGGGTPCFNDNIDLLKQKGLVVYLSLNTAVLANRLFHAKSVRPLLEPYKKDIGVLTNKIEAMLDERLIYYEQADLIFEAENMSKTKLDLLVERIMQLTD